MRAIYEQLFCLLSTCGDTSLEELVAHGTFVVKADRVSLSSFKGLTWQKCTGLLLFQHATFNHRTLVRKQNASRRQEGRYIRFPVA